MRSAMNLAVIKDRFAVAENEIDIALDIAVGKVLASGNAGLAVGSAVATAGVERVLIAEKANVAEDGSIGSDQHRQRLRPDGDLGVGGVPVVGEGEVLGAEVVAAYLGSGRVPMHAAMPSTCRRASTGSSSCSNTWLFSLCHQERWEVSRIPSNRNPVLSNVVLIDSRDRGH